MAIIKTCIIFPHPSIPQHHHVHNNAHMSGSHACVIYTFHYFRLYVCVYFHVCLEVPVVVAWDSSEIPTLQWRWEVTHHDFPYHRFPIVSRAHPRRDHASLVIILRSHSCIYSGHYLLFSFILILNYIFIVCPYFPV
jgi:hypothetical protein